MALIKYSALVAEMRNKLNGSVLSKNKAGNYVRNKITPVNPQTSYQQNVRSGFGNLSSSWRGLSETDRRAWDAAAPQFPYTNIFGDTKYLSGFQLYMKLNNNLAQIGEAPISAPPAPVEFPAFEMSDLVLAFPSTVTFNIDPATLPSGFGLIVYATGSITPGKTFIKNQYRLLGNPGVTAGTVTLSTLWAERFGIETIGNKVGVRAALISTTSGQIGVPFELVGITPTP